MLKNKKWLLILTFILLFLLSSCLPHTRNKPKNVILIIAKGLDLNALNFWISYHKAIEEPRGREGLIKLLNNGTIGLTHFQPSNTILADSASAGTALSCGVSTQIGFLGLDSKEKALNSLLDLFENKGKSTGIISNQRITDGILASFYAHTKTAQDENNIASQLSGQRSIEVILGGGLRHFLPSFTTSSDFLKRRNHRTLLGLSKRKDKRNLIDKMNKNGYELIFKETDLEILKKSTKKTLGIFAYSHFPFAIDRKELLSTSVPSLPMMLSKSLNILKQNRKGFFLVIESGNINETEKANDAGALLLELRKLNEVIKLALDFAQKDNETLIIFTGANPAGGFNFSNFKPQDKESTEVIKHYKGENYISPKILGILANQRKSLMSLVNKSLIKGDEKDEQDWIENNKVRFDFKKLRTQIKANFNLNIPLETLKKAYQADEDGIVDLNELIKDYQVFYDEEYLYSIVLAKVLSPYLGVTWSTGKNTGGSMITVAYGQNKFAFKGFINSTDIFKIISDLIAKD